MSRCFDCCWVLDKQTSSIQSVSGQPGQTSFQLLLCVLHGDISVPLRLKVLNYTFWKWNLNNLTVGTKLVLFCVHQMLQHYLFIVIFFYQISMCVIRWLFYLTAVIQTSYIRGNIQKKLWTFFFKGEFLHCVLEDIRVQTNRTGNVCRWK